MRMWPTRLPIVWKKRWAEWVTSAKQPAARGSTAPRKGFQALECFSRYGNRKLSRHYGGFHLFVGSFPQPNIWRATGFTNMLEWFSHDSWSRTLRCLWAVLTACAQAPSRQHLPWGPLGAGAPVGTGRWEVPPGVIVEGRGGKGKRTAKEKDEDRSGPQSPRWHSRDPQALRAAGDTHVWGSPTARAGSRWTAPAEPAPARPPRCEGAAPPARSRPCAPGWAEPARPAGTCGRAGRTSPRLAAGREGAPGASASARPSQGRQPLCSRTRTSGKGTRSKLPEASSTSSERPRRTGTDAGAPSNASSRVAPLLRSSHLTPMPTLGQALILLFPFYRWEHQSQRDENHGVVTLPRAGIPTFQHPGLSQSTQPLHWWSQPGDAHK